MKMVWIIIKALISFGNMFLDVLAHVSTKIQFHCQIDSAVINFILGNWRTE